MPTDQITDSTEKVDGVHGQSLRSLGLWTDRFVDMTLPMTMTKLKNIHEFTFINYY